MSIVSVGSCPDYDDNRVCEAIKSALAPLGGIQAFVRAGMKVLLKPNLLAVASPEQAVTTHPAVVRAVVSLVQEAGGTAIIGDSPAGPVELCQQVWASSGLEQVADQTGAALIPFKEVTWKTSNGFDYMIARPVLEADLVINLPKLKTHALTLYTGSVKNLFGTIPGNRKREVHIRAPGVQDFSSALVDILGLVKPGLTIMDGILGMEGNGPGTAGTPHHFGFLAASNDPVALDTIMTKALGFRPGEVLHLALAGTRGLGISTPEKIRLVADPQVLSFGKVDLPRSRWYLDVPSWVSVPVSRAIKTRPQVSAALCIGCGRCASVCPQEVISKGKPPSFDLSRCVGCMCCAEICPKAAITPKRNWIGRLVGVGS